VSGGSNTFVDVYNGAITYGQDSGVFGENGFYVGVGGSYAPLSVAAGGNISGGPPTDGFVVVDGDHYDCCSYGCSNYNTYYQVLNAYITFNPTPSPTPGANTTSNNHQSGGDKCKGPPPPPPMARYSVHSMLVSLNIEDRPLRYSPAFGPSVDFTVTYNQRDTQQPSTFTYSNLGPKWTFDWLSYVSDDPNTQLPLTGLYRSGGGAEIFVFDSGSQTFTPDAQSHATLVKTGAASYERRMPDGSKQVFGLSDGATSYPRHVFMTQIVDPAGNAVSIGYDASFRVTTITDALSQVTTLAYTLAGDPLKITQVTDPFGRFATFDYTNGQLTKITDEIGIQSQFTYTPGTDAIDSLTTPYGTTSFVRGESGTNRWIEMTDPLGGKERVEYRDQAPGISATDPVAPTATGITNASLDMANTFYWDKKAMLMAPGDYTQAKITHWLYNADGSVSGIASSEKQPLENRLWYTYTGQSDYQHAGPKREPLASGKSSGRWQHAALPV
jgi:YD repeat-containing protein